MMKAKDTIMTEDELVALPHYDRDTVLLAQAEISFKAGREQEKKEWFQKTDEEKARDNFTQQIIERSYAQGKREVVEWVESQRLAGFTLIQGIGEGIPISGSKWRAKLKKWGIK